MSRALFVNSNNYLKEAYGFADVEEFGVKALACVSEEGELHFANINGIGKYVVTTTKALKSIQRQLSNLGVNMFFSKISYAMVDNDINDFGLNSLYAEDGVYYELFWF